MSALTIKNILQSQQLAILGASPAFQEPCHVGRPNIGERTRFFDYAQQIFDNCWFTNHGPFVEQFEAELARFLEVKHCLTINNATIALQVAAQALGLSGEVLLPSFTFIATAHALHWLGLTPVFCDIDPLTHNLDPARLEEAITPRTSAILGVHLWGRPSALEALEEIARSRDLKLLFDAAHAFDCSYHGRKIANFGDAEVFSFHATKFFNTFEGGAIATNDDTLADRIRLVRNFGFTGYDQVAGLGTNGKMNELSAAMGLTNLQSLDHFVQVNRRNYFTYWQEFTTIPGLNLLHFDEREKNNYQYIIVEVDPHLTGLSRDAFIQVLHAENVLARRYFWPGCHRMEPYHTLFPGASARLPHTEWVSERTMALPTGTAISQQDIHTIAHILRTAVTHAPEIRTRLNLPWTI